MNPAETSRDATTSFEKISYAAHSKEYTVHFQDGKVSAHAQSWLKTNTVGYWIQYRLRNSLAPLLRAYPHTKWLTVGDGGFGNDAHYLLQQGMNVLATDISIDLLAEAKRIGYIKDYARENAEGLSFAQASFDFVLCKEAYHHFPRPYMALYEMLRVAKHGVVLIEPFDSWVGGSALSAFARNCFAAIRLLTGKKTERHGYEPIGNYQYTLSVREMEKVAVAMNFPAIAHLHLNSFYRPGVEFAALDGPGRSRLYFQAKCMLWLKNTLSQLGLIPYGLVVVVIFKSNPTTDATHTLQAGGFSFEKLPANPYLSADRK